MVCFLLTVEVNCSTTSPDDSLILFAEYSAAASIKSLCLNLATVAWDNFDPATNEAWHNIWINIL